MVLQAFIFGHKHGARILLEALASDAVRFPTEVYDQDEDASDAALVGTIPSEFARGIRYARQQVRRLPEAEARRYARWLVNLEQLAPLIERGKFLIDPLTVAELPDREALRQRFGIGRGEAAGLVLALRSGSAAVFLSSDDRACEVARALGVSYRTIVTVLRDWIGRTAPSRTEVEESLAGFENARFALARRERDVLLSAASNEPGSHEPSD